jgi:hypothetical protein
MSEAAAALALGFTTEWQGQTYNFAPMDNLKVQALYEAYLEDQAVAAVRRMKRKVSDDEYALQMDGVRRDMAAGVYAWRGDQWIQSVRSRTHIKHLLWLMGCFHQQGFDRALVDAMFEDPEKMAELMFKMFGLAPRGEGHDPNRPAPGHASPATTTA